MDDPEKEEKGKNLSRANQPNLRLSHRNEKKSP